VAGRGAGKGARQTSDVSGSGVSASTSFGPAGSASGRGPTNFTSRATTLSFDRGCCVLASIQRSCFRTPLTRTSRPLRRNWEQSSASRR
jgi:hypothetical protein